MDTLAPIRPHLPVHLNADDVVEYHCGRMVDGVANLIRVRMRTGEWVTLRDQWPESFPADVTFPAPGPTVDGTKITRHL